MHRREFVASAIGGAASPLFPASIRGRDDSSTNRDSGQFDEESPARVSYVPSLQAVSTVFRKWQVSALLNQAGDLSEQALSSWGVYSSALNAATSQRLSLHEEAFTIALEEARQATGAHKRELLLNAQTSRYFTDSKVPFDIIVREAKKLEDYTGTLSGGVPEWGRNMIVNNEKLVTRFERDLQTSLLSIRDSWTSTDALDKEKSLAERRRAYNERLALTRGGSALDLDVIADRALQLVEQSYVQAVDRIVVADLGLAHVYGFAPSFKAPSTTTSLGDGVIALSLWVRGAIQRVVAYEQLDQSFTRVVPLRQLVEKQEASAWTSLQRAQDSYSLTVKLPHDLFDHLDNVRVRGIGASLIGDAGAVPWSAEVEVPKRAVYLRNGRVDPALVTGDRIPSCVLGRVENRRSPRPTEFGGQVSVVNASPLGGPGDGDSAAWVVKLVRPKAIGERFSDLTDVLLELNCVGRPVLFR